MKLVAVCISRQPVEWENGWPFYNLAEDIELSTRDPYEYTKALAEKRNRAVAQALEKYPNSDHVMMCDSYYASQTGPLHQLVHDYAEFENRAILGGAIWGVIVTSLGRYFRGNPYLEWFDRWAVPEMSGLRRIPVSPGRVFIQVSSVGGVNIFPRTLWDQGIRYGPCQDLHGCEHNYFCEQTDMPKLIDLRAEFRRQRIYPFMKCLRMSLHLGRLIGR